MASLVSWGSGLSPDFQKSGCVTSLKVNTYFPALKIATYHILQPGRPWSFGKIQNWGEADFLTELQQSSTLCFLPNKFLPRRWFSGREKEVVGSTSASKVGIPIGPWLWYTWYVWRGKKAAPNLSPIWQAEVRWCLHLCFACTWSADLWPPLGTLVRHLHSDPETWPRNNWALG